MGNYPKKEVEDIKKETERIVAEQNRRMEELKSKLVGQELQNIEKQRKRPEVNSARERILLHITNTLRALENIANASNFHDELFQERTHLFLVQSIQHYFSIKADLNNIFKDNYMNSYNIFPDNSIPINTDSLYTALLSLNRIIEREVHILTFLNRMN